MRNAHWSGCWALVSRLRRLCSRWLFACLLVGVHAVGADRIVADSAEVVVDGIPDAWGLYKGKGEAELLASRDAHSGTFSACLRVHALGEWRGQSYLNVGLMLGRTGGYDGTRAIEARSGALYRLTFWLKGSAPWTRVILVFWVDGTDARSRTSVSLFPEALTPDRSWRRHEAWFQAPPRATRLAVKWQLAGFEHEGMRPGEIVVDDVTLDEMGALQPKRRRRLVITADINPMIGTRPLDAVLADVKAGRQPVVGMVQAIIAAADRWAAKSDSWYLHRTPVHTPLGMWTVACPFHPQRVRDFSKDNFLWNVDQPWRLACPLCRAEGRALFYYPNERYPDDGQGCYPSAAVWGADHDAAWSRAHGGIPHDHWDGSPHGYSERGYCYFFIGKCAHEMMTFAARDILPALAEAYVLAPHLDDVSQDRREAYARTVKIVLFSLARAHLGDAYLQAVEDLSSEAWRALLEHVYTNDPGHLRHRVFPGFRRYDLQDGIEGSSDHPAHPQRSDIYGDGSYRGDAYVSGWLQSYALVRASFSPSEELLRRLTERILVAGDRDAEALAGREGVAGRAVKPGKLDLALEPYAMTVGHSNNLGGRELANQFDLGVLLNDHEIVGTVVDNVWFYLRNYFNADGLGRETSPAYTNCAWNCLRMIIDRIDGYRGGFGPGHPWWDPRRQALNPFLDAEMAYDAAQAVFCLYPNGSAIPWMDSHAGHGLQMHYLERIQRDGNGIPEELRRHYRVIEAQDGVSIEPLPETLPSRLLHESRKAVIRLGKGADQALLSLDFAPNTGHYHPAPMDLVLYAEGHELASDLGYFGAMHWLTRDWIRTCPAHNTCVIRDEVGRHDFIHEVQGELRTIWHAGDTLGVIEVIEEDSKDLAHIPGDSPVYARTVLMVQTPVTADGRERHYVVDLFRVRGGAWHDYMFHSQGARCFSPSLTLNAAPLDRTLHELSGFSDRREATRGIGRIDRIRHGVTRGDVTVVWQDVADFTREPPVRSPDTGLRLTLLGGSAETRIFLGQAPGERRMSNVDRGEPLHVVCARRRNTAAVDVFAALIEPFRGEPAVENVEPLTLNEPAPADAVALSISYGDVRDVVVSLPPGNTDPVTVEAAVPGCGALVTDADLVIARFIDGDIAMVCLFGGSAVRTGGVVVRQRQRIEASLVGLDPTIPALMVESLDAIPGGRGLSGEPLIVVHDYGTSTFTLGAVDVLEDNRYRLRLAERPRLFDNLLRVTRRLGPLMAIEPPPSLPRRFDSMGYRVWAHPLTPTPVHVAGIKTWRQGVMTLDNAPDVIADGDTIGVTRLLPGTDTVLIPARTQWQRSR